MLYLCKPGSGVASQAKPMYPTFGATVRSSGGLGGNKSGISKIMGIPTMLLFGSLFDILIPELYIPPGSSDDTDIDILITVDSPGATIPLSGSNTIVISRSSLVEVFLSFVF